jgi:transposase InsO family protein
MGCLPHTFGRERIGYSCGTLFVNHASGKLFNFCQYSTNDVETISSKRRLESLARQEEISIKTYHADNSVFALNAFKEDCASLDQRYSFSGVGARHQNGIAEQNIKTVAQWARANMLHFAHHWPAKANIHFWPQAIDYALWVFNCLPNLLNGLSPNKICSSCRAPTEKLNWSHVFGCPVYVLDAALQDGHKIP